MTPVPATLQQQWACPPSVFLDLSAPNGFVRLTQEAWWLKEQTALTSHASMLAASRRLTVWRTSAPNKFLSSSKLLSKSILAKGPALAFSYPCGIARRKRGFRNSPWMASIHWRMPQKRFIFSPIRRNRNWDMPHWRNRDSSITIRALFATWHGQIQLAA